MCPNNTLCVIYKRLQENRKLEIQNLWQRSIFLATFLVLCFTGYGVLIGKMIDPKCCVCCACCVPCKIDYMDIIAIFISLVGIIMSILWIAMAKGSKAWQEVYEDAIGKIEEDLKIPEQYRSENLKGNAAKRDMNIWSMRGGSYSPSKINIAIGQISFVIWILIFVTHLTCLIKISIEIDKLNYCVPIGIVTVIVSVIIWLMLRDPYNKKNKPNCFNVVSEHLSCPDDTK